MFRKRGLAIGIAACLFGMLFVSCGNVTGGSPVNFDGQNDKSLNAAELQIAGRTFKKGDISYYFDYDKTGTMDGISASVRAVNSGTFDWSAKEEGSDIKISIKQGGSTTEATYSTTRGSLSVDGNVFEGDILDAVVSEMNLARINPKEYAEKYIEPRLANFDGLIYNESKVKVQTQEGAAVVQELIDLMKKTPAMDPLSVEQGLRLAAKDHAAYLASSGNMGHEGANGSNANARTAKYGNPGSGFENINYGPDRADARKIVIQQLIDDGTSDRGHRLNILNSRLTKAGSYTAKYATKPSFFASVTDDVHVCVINFATSYTTTSTDKVTDSLSDNIPEIKGIGETPSSLAGTSWIEETSTYNTTMYSALYFKDENNVGLGECNSLILALDYAKESLTGGHHYDGSYTYSRGKGKITTSANTYMKGNFTVEGDLLTLTVTTPGGGTATVKYRMLASVSSDTVAKTRWCGKIVMGADFDEGTLAYVALVFDANGKVQVGSFAGEEPSKKFALGQPITPFIHEGTSYSKGIKADSTYSYSNGSGSITLGSWQETEAGSPVAQAAKTFATNKLSGNFSIDLSTKKLTFANGTVLDLM